VPRRSPGTGTIRHLKGHSRPWKASRVVGNTTEMQSFERKGDAEKWLIARPCAHSTSLSTTGAASHRYLARRSGSLWSGRCDPFHSGTKPDRWSARLAERPSQASHRRDATRLR